MDDNIVNPYAEKLAANNELVEAAYAKRAKFAYDLGVLEYVIFQKTKERDGIISSIAKLEDTELHNLLAQKAKLDKDSKAFANPEISN